jgi:GR25 family glycosyltransferase involved in LPS biosynthesis
VEFVIVARHPDNPVQGIFESHLLCLRKGLTAGAQHILVFEDDVFFRNFDSRALGEACAGLERIGNWNALFLGCITSGSSKTGTRSLARIRYHCLAHAYALNGAFAERIVREKWNDIPYDVLLRKHSADFFAVYPMFAFQGLSGTDNRTVRIDRMRRFFGGLPFIQQMNELYQNHKAPVLAVHLIVLLGLAVLACRLW